MKIIYVLLIGSLLVLSGCAEMAPKYSPDLYPPETNILRDTYQSVNFLVSEENSILDHMTDVYSFREGLADYMMKMVPAWKLDFWPDKVNPTLAVNVKIELSKNGWGNYGYPGAKVNILYGNSVDEQNIFDITMAGQTSFATKNDYFVRESYNFGIIVGQKILNVLAGDKKLVANASAKRKKLEEQENLEKERANPKNSLKRATA